MNYPLAMMFFCAAMICLLTGKHDSTPMDERILGALATILFGASAFIQGFCYANRNKKSGGE